MIAKNIEKEERKARRKQPIPFTRKGPTKRGLLQKQERKYKKSEIEV